MLARELTHEEWLAERRKYIGGSDAAAVLGVSKWKSPHQVWLEKTGRVPPQPDSDEMFMGRELEAVIASIYERDHSCELVKPTRQFVVHPKFPMIAANADRLWRGRRRGVEIKTANYFAGKDWGEPGTDQVPSYYLPQPIVYMSVYEYNDWDVAVSIAGGRPQYYPLHRDRNMEIALLVRLAEWWDKHIVDGTEPELDGSKQSASYLAKAFPRNFRPLKRASDEAIAMMTRLARARATRKAAREEIDLLQNHLKKMIGDADGIDHPDIGRVTWKRTGPSATTDWEAIARHFAILAGLNAGVFDGFVQQNTTIKRGARRFLFCPKD